MTDREKFEAWYLERWKSAGGWAASYTPEDVAAMRGDDGEYIGGYITGCWHGWQAALASQQPADDDWIDWAGGECPVDSGVAVDVRFRDGEVVCAAECRWCWHHNGIESDIIAYRVVKP